MIETVGCFGSRLVEVFCPFIKAFCPVVEEVFCPVVEEDFCSVVEVFCPVNEDPIPPPRRAAMCACLFAEQQKANFAHICI